MSENKQSSGPHPDNKASLEQAAMQDGHMQDVHAQLMREKEEPHEGFSPVPIVLMFLFAALCFWGGVYLVHYSGKFRWDVYTPHYTETAAVVVVEPLFDVGKKVFSKQCAVCHQPTGAGVPGVYPPIAGSEWVTDHPEMVARILINGLNGPIEVKGNTYNGNMPAFGPGGLNLSKRKLAGVITYIRQEWGNEAPDMTEAMIEDYIAKYSSRSTPWTAAELKEDLGPIPEPVAELAPSSDDASDVAAGPDFSELVKAGGKVFKANCVVCHQASGAGIPGVFPSLAGSEWVTGSEERLARILINGLGGPIEIKGTTYNGVMPAIGPSGSNLKSKDIAAVMTFIRQEWGNAAPGVTVEKVDAYLKQYSSRSTPWTADEVSADLAAEPTTEVDAAHAEPAGH